MLRLGITSSKPGSFKKLSPQIPKYVWKGSEVVPGHFEKL